MHDEGLALGESAEVAPGVVVERRCFLTVAAAAFGAAGFARAGEAPGRSGRERVTLEKFIEEVLPVARDLVRDTSPTGEDRYLHVLAAHAVRLGDVPTPELRPSGQGEKTYIGVSWAGDPFIVLHWRMEPGSAIRLHAHTYGNVCTLGLEGQARIRNFEMLAAADFDAQGTIRLRRTQDQILTPGRINLVPLSHGYVHGFQAGSQGARGLDITTRIRKERPTPFLDLAPEPVDPENAVYEGSWTT